MNQAAKNQANQTNQVNQLAQSQSTLQFPGEIRLIAHDRDMAEVKFEKITAIGFDTETKPAFRKGEVFKTALLQLATDSVAYLIRLHYIRKFEPLQEVFENPEILKVGAAIGHDLKQLQHVFPFQPAGFVDVQKIGKEKGLKNLGLKKMTQEVFNANLFKGPKMTNWERQFLTDEQMLYAATDAWIGLQLYRALTAPPPQP
jgi:ribonuclease D